MWRRATLALTGGVAALHVGALLAVFLTMGWLLGLGGDIAVLVVMYVFLFFCLG